MKSISSNVKTAVAASTICLVLILAIALLSAKPSSDTILKRPSTFFTDPTGARAIYMVLQRALPSVGQWRLPVTDLRKPYRSAPTTLIAMEPNPFGQAEANALDQWIASGGQLILASNTDWHVQKSQSDKTVKDFLSRHGIQAGSQPAKSAIDAAVVQAVGRGRIIYVPDSYAFSNEALRKSDNAVWLVQRCAEWNGGGVLFDEYHHDFGAQRSLIALIAMFAVTPWGLVCVQLGLAGAIYMVGCKRRFGRPQAELPAERTNPIESVRALGGLFETAQARALSARAMHQYLNAQVSSIM